MKPVRSLPQVIEMLHFLFDYLHYTDPCYNRETILTYYCKQLRKAGKRNPILLGLFNSLYKKEFGH